MNDTIDDFAALLVERSRLLTVLQSRPAPHPLVHLARIRAALGKMNAAELRRLAEDAARVADRLDSNPRWNLYEARGLSPEQKKETAA